MAAGHWTGADRSTWLVNSRKAFHPRPTEVKSLGHLPCLDGQSIRGLAPTAWALFNVTQRRSKFGPACV